ncbi:hypothetical protein, partial [Bifidobacterium vespertilionis]|uniref:hypothetical protein n=1 Tax=Bifidobacterium vespertilionis TaxID=2562524 RepID=UPI001CC32BBC
MSDAAATVIAAPASATAGASEHARARAHAHLEHGLWAHGVVDDANILDDHAFDVEKTFEYAVHQALCGCVFILVENILPGKRSSLTASTPQPRTTTHENSSRAPKSIIPYSLPQSLAENDDTAQFIILCHDEAAPL